MDIIYKIYVLFIMTNKMKKRVNNLPIRLLWSSHNSKG